MAKPILQPIEAIEKDDLDRAFYREMSGAKALQALSGDDEVRQTFTQDIWTSLYRGEPQLAKPASIQKQVMKSLMEMREYQDLHESTAMDDIASALGTSEIGQKAHQQLTEIAQKVEERQKEQQKQKGKGPQQPGPGQPGNQPGQPGEGEGEGDGPEMTPQEQSALRQALRAGIEAAQEQADDWTEMKRSWGIDPGQLAQMDPQARMELASTLMKQKGLRRISDMVGRLKNVVDSAFAQSPDHGASELHDVTIGRDLARLLPSELLKLRRSRTEFYRDYLEGKLLCYSLKGQDELGKGPILVAVDESGSMHGQPIEWAKSVAVALMHLADKEKRAFGYLTFDTQVATSKFWDRSTAIKLEDKLELATHELSGGGTAFDPPLAKAFEMREQIAGFKQADLVFITDGECDVADLKKVLAEKKRLNMRIFGILISPSGRGGQVLEQFCDQVAVVREGTVELAGDIIRQALARGNDGK